MKPLPALDLAVSPEASTRPGRRQRIAAAAVFVALVSSGITSCTKTQIALSSAAIAAVIVGTTVGVTLAVQKHNHTLQGCVFSDAGGLKLRTSDARVYRLKGDDADIKVGDRVKFHGLKAKKAKGADQVFVVQKVSKDFGPCPANFATSQTATR